MNDKDQEKLADLFASLPRKQIPAADKEAVWFRIQNHIRTAKLAEREIEENRWGKRGLVLSKVGVALVIVLVAVSAAGLAQASRGSLPGETLYSIKKVVEKVEIAIATSPEKKVKVLSTHAKNRLEEVVTLVHEEKADEDIVTKTLADYKTTTEEVGKVVESALDENPELANQAIELASEDEEILSSLEEEVEGEVKHVVKEAIKVSRNSISKLKAAQEGQEGEVEGVTEVEENEFGDTATSTSTTSPPVETSPSPESQNEVIESQIQINGVFASESDDDDTEEPEIVPEPTRGL